MSISDQETEIFYPKFRLALIGGTGSIGKIHQEAIGNISSETNLELGTSVGRNYDGVISDPAYPQIAIATPPDTHFYIAKEALLAGKDVLLEKPPTLTLQQSEELIRLSEQEGRVLYMSFHARHTPVVSLAKEVLHDKNVVGISIVYKENVHKYHPNSDSWIFDPHRAGGGVIMDTGINAISVVTAVLPQANLIVENARLEQHENIGVETAGNIDFTFGPETKGQMVLDWMHTGPEERTISFQTDHHDFWTIDINTGRLSCNGETRYETGNSLLEEYTAVYRDFIKHCKARTSSYSTKELAFVLDSYLYANYFSQSI